MHFCDTHHLPALTRLLARYNIKVQAHARDASLPGSFWGEPEAGIVGNALHVRPDTPVHSALHEACHLICMDSGRRADIHTDAGGSDPEEAAVCLLQVLLAGHLPGVGSGEICIDMDAWGYSFRLGSTAAWLAGDSTDSAEWLRVNGLIDARGAVTFRKRE